MTLLDTAVGMTDTTAECRFCVHDGPTTGENSIVLEHGNRAVATIGPLVPMWSLVLATTHVPATSWLSPDDREALFSDVTALSVRLAQPRVFFFEHGASSEGSLTACTTAHAHVHVVPVNADVIAHADRYFPLEGMWETVEISDLDRFRSADYLLAGELGGVVRLKVLHEPVSQYFRRVIAHLTGQPDRWNWRTHSICSDYSRTQLLLSSLERPLDD